MVLGMVVFTELTVHVGRQVTAIVRHVQIYQI